MLTAAGLLIFLFLLLVLCLILILILIDINMDMIYRRSCGARSHAGHEKFIAVAAFQGAGINHFAAVFAGFITGLNSLQRFLRITHSRQLYLFIADIAFD